METVNYQFSRAYDLKLLFPSLAKFLSPDTSSMEYSNTFKAMFREMIMDHERDHDVNSSPRDYIDQYLTEIKTRKEPELFYREQLVANCFDFFEAGTETSSTTLR